MNTGVQKMNYELLRPFDLEAAKRGEALYYRESAPFEHVAGPNRHETVVVRGQDEQFYLTHANNLRMAPLAWVEGRPVYKGDVLWHRHAGEGIVVGKAHTKFNEIDLQYKTFTATAAIENLTWTPPKVKREGWVLLDKAFGTVVVRCSKVYATEREAMDIRGSVNDRASIIACVRIEWEER